MKIAIFTDTFYPTTNWIVTSIISFSEAMAEKWNEIIIICPYNKWIEKFSSKNIEIIPIKWLPAFFYPDFKITFWFTPKLLKKIKSFSPDLIHFHTQFILSWQAIIISRLFKIPIVWTFHTFIADESYLKVIGLDNLKIFWKIWWRYNNFFYKNAKLVIAPSEIAKKELVNHGIDASKVEIISNPVPLKKVNLEKIDILKTDKQDIILYVWRLSKEKNIDIALRAISVVSRDIKDILFVIVWEWPELQNLKKMAFDLWIKDNVVFLWKIEHDKLLSSNIFDKSKIFLTTSPSEVQWITILEAMSFWLAIVWVNKWWVAELIESNWFIAQDENYWEVALFVYKLLKDEKLLEEMWKESIRLVKKYDISLKIEQLEKLYLKAINE